MKKIILITMLLFSSLATAEWCTGAPDQNIDAARTNFQAACGEPYNDQKGHVCDYKSDGYHCNGNTSASASSPTQAPVPTTQQSPADPYTEHLSDDSSPAQGQNLTLTAPNRFRINLVLGPPVLEWGTVLGAAGYNIYRDNKYLDTMTRIDGNLQKYTDSSAPKSGTVKYYITAFDASKSQFSPRSDVYTVATLGSTLATNAGPTLLPAKPRGLTMRTFGDTIVFKWDATPSEGDIYEIVIDPGVPGGGVIASTSDKSIIISGMPARKYNFNVQLKGAYFPAFNGHPVEITDSAVKAVREGRIPSFSKDGGKEVILTEIRENGALVTSDGSTIRTYHEGDSAIVMTVDFLDGRFMQIAYGLEGDIDVGGENGIEITSQPTDTLVVNTSGYAITINNETGDFSVDNNLERTADGSYVAMFVSPDGSEIDVVTVNPDGSRHITHHSDSPGAFTHLADDGRDNGNSNTGGGTTVTLPDGTTITTRPGGGTTTIPPNDCGGGPECNGS